MSAQRGTPDSDSASLARALAEGLAGNAGSLSLLLGSDPASEPGLTALADLALFASILERDHPSGEVWALANAVRSVLVPQVVGAAALGAGPEQWAIHAAHAWLDADAERERLRDAHVHACVAESKRIVLALGPPWRPEEAMHVAARVEGTRLPPLRAVTMEGSLMSLYELAHVAMYATDFGAVSLQGPLPDASAATASEVAGALAGDGPMYDVGVELILAARYLSGRWPPEADDWIDRAIPEWAETALVTVRHEPDAFLHRYHPMILTVLALSRAAADGR